MPMPLLTTAATFVLAVAGLASHVLAQAPGRAMPMCVEGCGQDHWEPVAWTPGGTSLLTIHRSECHRGAGQTSPRLAPMALTLEPDRPVTTCFNLDKGYGKPHQPIACTFETKPISTEAYDVAATGLLATYSVKAKPLGPDRLRVTRKKVSYPVHGDVAPPCQPNGYDSPRICEHIEVALRHRDGWKVVWKGVRNAQSTCDTATKGGPVKMASEDVRVWASPSGHHLVVGYREYRVTSFRSFHDATLKWVELPKELTTGTAPQAPR